MKTRRRRPLRKPGHDYSSPGQYFVTICTSDRRCLFGHIDNGEMVYSDAGQMVHRIWTEIPSHYCGIDIDTVQVMPDHMHGIICIPPVGMGPRAHPMGPRAHPMGPRAHPMGPRAHPMDPRAHPMDPRAHPDEKKRAATGSRPHAAPTPPQQGAAPAALSLPNVIERFKSLTTTQYINGVKNEGWPTFEKRLWQRGYHDHIVRDEQDLTRIREYIRNNPITEHATR